MHRRSNVAGVSPRAARPPGHKSLSGALSTGLSLVLPAACPTPRDYPVKSFGKVQGYHSNAAVRACVRDGRDATGPSSRASEHPETAARARRRLQPRAAAASDDRRGHAPEPSGPDRGPLSCPVPAMSRPVEPSGTPPAALHATLVADVHGNPAAAADASTYPCDEGKSPRPHHPANKCVASPLGPYRVARHHPRATGVKDG